MRSRLESSFELIRGQHSVEIVTGKFQIARYDLYVTGDQSVCLVIPAEGSIFDATASLTLHPDSF